MGTLRLLDCRLVPALLLSALETHRPFLSFSQFFKRKVTQLGLPAIRLHDVRHSHASVALAAGVHPKVVSERLGHASVAFTLDTYTHAIPALEEDAAELIAALVGAEAS